MEQSLPGVFALLKTAWGDFRARPYFFVGVSCLAVVSMYIFAFAFGAAFALLMPSMQHSFVISGIILALLAIVGSVAILWVQTMSVVSVTTTGRVASIEELSARSWGVMWSYAWLMLLSTLIVMGGFVLLIVPGIIVSVWLSLSMFVFAEEGVKGMSALLKSRAYVRGRWWSVVRRIVGGTIVLMLINLVVMGVSMVSQMPLIDVIGGAIVTVVMTPIFMLYLFALYASVRAQGEVLPEVYEGKRTMFTVFGILGLLFIPAILVLSVGITSMQSGPQYMNSRVDVKMIQVALELYFDKEGVYPETLDALVAGGYMESLPLFAQSDSRYVYERRSDTEYLLCDPASLLPESLIEATDVRRCVSSDDTSNESWEGGGDAGDPMFE